MRLDFDQVKTHLIHWIRSLSGLDEIHPVTSRNIRRELWQRNKTSYGTVKETKVFPDPDSTSMLETHHYLTETGENFIRIDRKFPMLADLELIFYSFDQEEAERAANRFFGNMFTFSSLAIMRAGGFSVVAYDGIFNQDVEMEKGWERRRFCSIRISFYQVETENSNPLKFLESRSVSEEGDVEHFFTKNSLQE